jgi:hypothetical protein
MPCLPTFSDFTKNFLTLPKIFWVYQKYSKCTKNIPSLPKIFWVYWKYSEFTKNILTLPTFLSTLLTFIVFIDKKIMWFFVPTFTEFIPTCSTVNCKFLITDFRLLSTSVKPKNFIEFYRGKKKMKHPWCLQTMQLE